MRSFRIKFINANLILVERKNVSIYLAYNLTCTNNDLIDYVR